MGRERDVGEVVLGTGRARGRAENGDQRGETLKHGATSPPHTWAAPAAVSGKNGAAPTAAQVPVGALRRSRGTAIRCRRTSALPLRKAGHCHGAHLLDVVVRPLMVSRLAITGAGSPPSRAPELISRSPRGGFPPRTTGLGDEWRVREIAATKGCLASALHCASGDGLT